MYKTCYRIPMSGKQRINSAKGGHPRAGIEFRLIDDDRSDGGHGRHGERAVKHLRLLHTGVISHMTYLAETVWWARMAATVLVIFSSPCLMVVSSI